MAADSPDTSQPAAPPGALMPDAEQLHALIEHGSDIALLLDQQGIILYAGPSTPRLLGWLVI